MDPSLYKFINTTKCRRKMILGHFGDISYNDEVLATGPYCDNCPSYINLEFATTSGLKSSTKPMHSFPYTPFPLQAELCIALDYLHGRLFIRDCVHLENDTLPKKWIISNKQLDKLVRNCCGISIGAHLQFIPEFTFDKYFNEHYGKHEFEFFILISVLY